MRVSFGGLADDALDRVTSLRISGPSLPVHIGFDPSYRYDPRVRPLMGDEEYFALVDTGATENCIDEALATALRLPIIARETFAGAGGLSGADIYLAQLHVPATNFTLYGRFLGVQLLAGRQPHLALLGRTFLQEYTMTYEGRTGVVTLSDE